MSFDSQRSLRSGAVSGVPGPWEHALSRARRSDPPTTGGMIRFSLDGRLGPPERPSSQEAIVGPRRQQLERLLAPHPDPLVRLVIADELAHELRALGREL